MLEEERGLRSMLASFASERKPLETNGPNAERNSNRS
jgi:hypothetical protein